MVNDKIYMIGALDCYGVPYTPDNLNQESYLDMAANQLRNDGINLDYVNLHSIAFNKTWQLEKILNKDYTKEKYYRLNQRASIQVIKMSKRFDHPVNSDFLSYYDNPINPNLKITTTLKNSKEPIFVYSCGGMNFDYYMNMPSGDIKKIISEFLFHLKTNLAKTFNDIENTWMFIKKINPNVKIYVFGIYPMIEQKFLRYMIKNIYKLYNDELSKRCKKYENVYFVDVFENINHVAPHDNHPNYEGQCYMKKQLINSIYKHQ